MNCTDFAKGLAVGMLSGGAVVCLFKCRRRRKFSALGLVLKVAGSVLDTVSRTLGM